MIPVSKDKLSKLKNIYIIYKNSCDEIHIEQFPIVYINKNFVYFKTNKCAELQKVRTKNVKEFFPNEDNIDDISKYGYNYFWFADCEKTKEDISIIKLMAKIKNQNKKEKEIKDKISKYNNEIKRLEKELNGLENGR